MHIVYQNPYVFSPENGNESTLDEGGNRLKSGGGHLEPRRGLGQSRAGFTPNPGGFLKKPAEVRAYARCTCAWTRTRDFRSRDG